MAQVYFAEFDKGKFDAARHNMATLLAHSCGKPGDLKSRRFPTVTFIR
jgi:hypothetical protein